MLREEERKEEAEKAVNPSPSASTSCLVSNSEKAESKVSLKNVV